MLDGTECMQVSKANLKGVPSSYNKPKQNIYKPVSYHSVLLDKSLAFKSVQLSLRRVIFGVQRKLSTQGRKWGNNNYLPSSFYFIISDVKGNTQQVLLIPSFTMTHSTQCTHVLRDITLSLQSKNNVHQPNLFGRLLSE